jgi:hypothetical protein
MYRIGEDDNQTNIQQLPGGKACEARAEDGKGGKD